MADHSITIDVIGKNLQETVSLLKEIRDDIKNINSTPVTVKVNTAAATRALNLLRQELGSIAQYLNQGSRNNSDAMMETINSGVDSIIQKLGELNSMTVSPDIDTSGIEQGATAAERLASGLEVAAGVANGLSSVFSGIADFSGMFASSVEGMANMFNFDTLGTAKRYLTAMATRAVTSQISGIIERYDIMNTFQDYMELAGVSGLDASNALNAVDLSIRGIPIGLDEAAFRLRKYQMYMNDIDRATNFTIGIQKAITAGGASEQMKTTAYTQIDRLLATGKLGQSRQWLSLFNGLGVSLRFLREELALDPTADLKTIASDLADGTIPVEDFIHAIERLADNEGLDRALEIYKGTIEAWKANINNAIKRGGQNIMENVNGVMNDVLGYGITGVMRRVRDGIDDISKSAGEYIQANPQNVQTISEAIGGLINRAMTLDGGRFITNVINNIGGVADVIGRIFDSLPDNFLEDFVSFATTWAGPMATVMKAAQSGLGVVLGVFERLQSLDPAELIEKIVKQIENMANIIAGLLDLIPDGLLGDLMAFGLVWGRPLANVLSSIGGALQAISAGMTAGSFSTSGGLLGQLSWLVTNQPMLALAAGTLAAIAIAYYDMKQYIADLEQSDLEKLTSNLGDIEKLNSETEKAISNAAQKSGELASNIETINLKADEAHQAAANIRELNDQIEELSKPLPYSNMSETRDTLLSQRTAEIERLASLFPELTLEVDKSTGALTENSQALLDQADAYIDYMSNVGLAKAYREGIEGESDIIFGLQQQKEDARRRQADALQYLARVRNDLAFTTAMMDQAYANYEYDPSGSNLETYTKWNEANDRNLAQLELAEDAYKDVSKDVTDYDLAIKEHLATIEKYGRSIEELRVAQSKFAGTEWVIDGVKQQYKELDEDIQNLIADYSLLREEAEKTVNSVINGFDEMKPPETQGIDTTVTNLDQQGQTAEKWATSLTTILNFMKYLHDNGMEEYFSGFAPIANEIAQGGDEAIGVAAGVADAIEKFLGGDTSSIDGLIATYGDRERWKQATTDALAGIEEGFKSGGTIFDVAGENPEEMPGLAGLLREQIVGPIEDMVNSFAPDGEIGQALTENLQATTEGVTASVEPVTKALESVQTAAEKADGAISNLATTASGKAGEMGSFSGSLDSVASSAANAFSNVSALAGAISRLQDKTITIKVNVLGSLGRLAQGGMAGYYASGGNVSLGFPGMGSGTDIIPAWLTPGEYVMRRSAVGLFGSRFMDRVNKMDIGGAFDALMTRISNPMMHGNTYNRDNHATVNNYFYGDNGQNYSQRKAYRYVGSL